MGSNNVKKKSNSFGITTIIIILLFFMGIYFGRMAFEFHNNQNILLFVLNIGLFFLLLISFYIMAFKPRLLFEYLAKHGKIREDMTMKYDSPTPSEFGSTGDEMVCFLETTDYVQINLFRDLLVKEGIDTTISEQRSSTIYQFIPDTGYRLMITKKDWDKTEQLYREFQKSTTFKND